MNNINIFNTKEELLRKYNAKNEDEKKKIMIFQADKDSNFRKVFILSEPIHIFNKMLENENNDKKDENNYYEAWLDNTPLIFSLDIDIRDIYLNEDDIAHSLTSNVISGINEVLLHEYNAEKVIVLKSNFDEINGKKQSFHVIFRGLKFENVQGCKLFYEILSKKFDMSYSDASIYKITCFRTCFSSKNGVNNMLAPYNRMEIDGKKTCVFQADTSEELYKYWLKTLITRTTSDEILIETEELRKIHNEVCVNNIDDVVFYNNIKDIRHSNFSLEKIDDLLFKLPAKYYNDYDLWLKTGMILANQSIYNNGGKVKMTRGSDPYFELYTKWSKQSSNYKESEMIAKWKSFFKNHVLNKLSVGTLIYWLKSEGIAINNKKSIKDIVEEYPETFIKLSVPDKNNLLSEKNKNVLVINQAKFTPDIFTKILDRKIIAVQGEKGSGKTSNFLKALQDKGIFDNENLTILFVSSRKTFGAKLLSDLKIFGFELYSNIESHDITSKRVICQIDSLSRIQTVKYDYIVIDECESLARYLTSQHFVKNPKASFIVSQLETRLVKSDHIYLLDADLSDRSINYICNLLEYRNKKLNPSDIYLIQNTFKSYQDYKIIYSDFQTWLKHLFSAVELGKRLVIPSASNCKAKDIERYIKIKYPEKKVLIIHKETPDKDKVECLYRVNENWKLYDIVIYTPSVCMGVSFDELYFDNIYVYGCENSLGAQELCQMIHRVRTPNEKIIYLTLNCFKESHYENNLSVDRIERIISNDHFLTSIPELCNNFNKPIAEISEAGIIYTYPYKNEPFYDLYVKNATEIIENKINFGAALFGYVKHKHYMLEYLNDFENPNFNYSEYNSIIKKRKDEDNEKLNAGIFNSEDISEQSFRDLVNSKSDLTEKELYSIYRYRFKHNYDFNDEITLTKDLIEIYNKPSIMRMYKNLITIKNYINENNEIIQKTEEKLNIIQNINKNKFIDNCYSELSSKNYYSNHYYCLTIIKLLNFDINDLTISHDFELFKNFIPNALNFLDKNKDYISQKFDLNVYNAKILTFNTSRFIRLINRVLLTQYGVKILKNGKNYQLTDSGMWDFLPLGVRAKHLNDDFKFIVNLSNISI